MACVVEQAEEPLDIFGDAGAEDVCLALPDSPEAGEDVEAAMDQALVGTDLGLLSQVSQPSRHGHAGRRTRITRHELAWSAWQSHCAAYTRIWMELCAFGCCRAG